MRKSRSARLLVSVVVEELAIWVDGFGLGFFVWRRYVVVYFLILCARYNAGIVTDEMIDQPKRLFVAIGVLEALGVALGMASAGKTFDALFWGFFWQCGSVL